MDGLIYRRMLARRVQALSRKGEFDCRMAIPWFSEKCYGCGICAQLCPNGAIEIGEEKDGLRSIMITPYKCTVCGVCMETCREGGIEEICHAKLTSLERVTVAAVRSASCMRCGRAIAADMDERYCMVCSRKVKKR